ncbi:hypothetical protein OIK44_08540 [Janthinobacterium sp. hw3]|uniref:Uncharacterized protein n=1 Tax=Janthinobacterium fluminis TaxID=2987524 RepID=A0ABT5K1J2_9BURK|nr:hypothetical protein [Janthinobacterium fluminis]
MRLSVGAEALSLERAGGWRAAAAAPASVALAPGWDGAALDAALAQLLAGAGHAGWPLAVVLDDALLRLWQVAPPRGASRPADLDAAAALRFQTLYGEAAADWRIAGHWQARAPFFGAAPAPLLAALERAAAAHGVHIVAVVPQFVEAWQRCRGALRAGAWFGVLRGGMLTLAAIDAGRLRAVRALPLPQDAGHEWLTGTLRREALLLDLAAPALLQLCGAAPAWAAAPAGAGQIPLALFGEGAVARGGAGMPRLAIDFAPAGLRRALFQLHPAWWAGAALGLALCVSGALAGSAALAQQRVRAAELEQQARRAARLSRPAPPAAPLVAPERAAAVNAAVLRLNLPWRALQEAVAAATPATVALLTLEPDARKRVLKLGAEAKTSEAMIAYVEELKRQELFASVALTRHDINEQDPNRPVRFQLEARWAAP